jgi:hypothetical protein
LADPEKLEKQRVFAVQQLISISMIYSKLNLQND